MKLPEVGLPMAVPDEVNRYARNQLSGDGIL